MSNISVAIRIVTELLASGVQEFCLCAGARNSPFVQVFDQNPHIKVFHFFDERSAAFFALGRIGNTRKPVAVITTSGTAAAEMLPAAVEGTYSSLPLIMITADRPKRYRGSGAPQSIEQVGIFSYYIEVCFDIDEENTHLSMKGLSWSKPVHINVCFKEPLIDAEVAHIKIPEKSPRSKFPESFPMDMKDEIERFIENHKPLVILSTLPEKVRPAVLEFLTKLKAPIYAEGISNLRGAEQLMNFTIQSGDKIIQKLIDLNACDSIIRIGGVPTVRFWRDLEDVRKDLPVLSLGYNHFTGLSRPLLHYLDLDDLGRIEVDYTRKLDDEFWELDQNWNEKRIALFNKYPTSEPALFYHLSKHLKGTSVYLGNSLPVRYWDLAADFGSPPERVVANRGANGIDGQISTFIGWAKPETDNWCIVGDLTALYDMSALWAAGQVPESKMKLVIINNKGGMIFDRMFGKEIYLNRHGIEFESLANLWKWDYSLWKEIPSQIKLGSRHLVEIQPDENQTHEFWREWDQIK
jgi:2-succinyl-5-enolpyruvyl-6-hydroxy-3-cyclohexene-1-carboxylate synthase